MHLSPRIYPQHRLRRLDVKDRHIQAHDALRGASTQLAPDLPGERAVAGC